MQTSMRRLVDEGRSTIRMRPPCSHRVPREALGSVIVHRGRAESAGEDPTESAGCQGHRAPSPRRLQHSDRRAEGTGAIAVISSQPPHRGRTAEKRGRTTPIGNTLRSRTPCRGSRTSSIVDAMEHYGNRRSRVERLVSAWNQSHCVEPDPAGESDDPLIGASAEPKKRPRTRLTDEEVDAMRTARAQGVGANALARQFGVHRGTVWAKTRLA